MYTFCPNGGIFQENYSWDRDIQTVARIVNLLRGITTIFDDFFYFSLPII